MKKVMIMMLGVFVTSGQLALACVGSMRDELLREYVGSPQVGVLLFLNLFLLTVVVYEGSKVFRKKNSLAINKSLLFVSLTALALVSALSYQSYSEFNLHVANEIMVEKKFFPRSY